MCQGKVKKHMGHHKEGVKDLYLLVEGEVEGVLWTNRGAVADLKVVVIFTEPSKMLDAVLASGPKKSKWKAKSSECPILVFQKPFFEVWSFFRKKKKIPKEIVEHPKKYCFLTWVQGSFIWLCLCNLHYNFIIWNNK